MHTLYYYKFHLEAESSGQRQADIIHQYQYQNRIKYYYYYYCDYQIMSLKVQGTFCLIFFHECRLYLVGRHSICVFARIFLHSCVGDDGDFWELSFIIWRITQFQCLQNVRVKNSYFSDGCICMYIAYNY